MLECINEDDLNGDGEIEFIEFVVLVESLKNENDSLEELEKVFLKFAKKKVIKP